MDKYHCTFEIVGSGTTWGWTLRDHKHEIIARGNVYSNWHNAKRALDRHIKVIQSGNYTPPPKPLRKEYTFKAHANLQTSTTG